MKKILQKLSVFAGISMMTASGSLTAFASDASASSEVSTGGAVLSTFILPMVVLVFLYLLMIRPQQKQEKETRQMQENLQPGDEVITRGGIVGLVLRVDDNTKTVLIETGSNHVKLRVIQEAIVKNMTAEEAAASEKAKEQKNKSGISLGKPKDE
ncbi:MAG: preprotein translocase subunit YajC [Oscillospiraceae bacterium]|nr:preprotein translocase subunit YajC [Oscillospiraceae bacterium]